MNTDPSHSAYPHDHVHPHAFIFIMTMPEQEPHYTEDLFADEPAPPDLYAEGDVRTTDETAEAASAEAIGAAFDGVPLGQVAVSQELVVTAEPTPVERSEIMSSRRLLRPGDVAAIFKVTPHAVRNWADAGVLKGIRTPGGHFRFRAEEIQTFTQTEDLSEQFLSAREVAELYDVTPRTVTMWAEQGRLPGAIRTPGGQHRFRATAINEYLGSQLQ